MIDINVSHIYYPNMTSDDYRPQDIYRYSRKTYKKNRQGIHETELNNSQYDTHVIETDISPRSDEILDSPRCSCDIDPEIGIANIPHKKCPVITLAHVQLQRLLDETDKLLYENTRCCSSLCEFLWFVKEMLITQNKYYCIAILLIISAVFFIGLIFGAASCGSYHRLFNSPIMNFLNKLFIPESYYSNTENVYRIY